MIRIGQKKQGEHGFVESALNGHQWNEIKLPGKGVESRSYHIMLSYENKVYVYGGYELHSGILNDFIFIDFSLNQLNNWMPVESINPHDSPGPLCRYTACIYNKVLYIFGGKKNAIQISNKLFSFTFETKEWKFVQNNIDIPCIESHSGSVDNDQGKWYIFGGFTVKGYQNNLYCFNFNMQTWEQIQVSPSSQIPDIRASQGIAFYKDQIYLFGGSNGKVKLGDMWKFEIQKKEWQQIQSQPQTPSARSGHSFIVYNDNILLFGGICGVTKEKNDFYCFNLNVNQWRQIELYNDFIPNHFLKEISPIRVSKLKQKTNLDYQQQNMRLRYLQHSPSLRSPTRSPSQLSPSLSGNESPLLLNQEQNNSGSEGKQLLPKLNLPIEEENQQKNENNNDENQKNKDQQKQEKQHQHRKNKSEYHHRESILPIAIIKKTTKLKQKDFVPLRYKSQSLHFQAAQSPANYSPTGHRFKFQKVTFSNPFEEEPQIKQFERKQSILMQMKNYTNFGLSKKQLEKKPPENLQELESQIKNLSVNPLIDPEDKEKMIRNMKKKILLKEFELSEEEKSQRAIVKTPTSEAMRRVIVGIENKSARYKSMHNDNDQLQKNYKKQKVIPIEIQNQRIQSKKPQPRDGHAVCILNGMFLVFGGDRHKLSFNDLFECKLDSIKEL